MKNELLSKSWLLPALVVGIAVAYVTLVLIPGQRKIRQLADDVEAHQAFVAQSQAITPALAVTQQEIQRAEQYRTVWEQASPHGPNLAGLFGQINGLAKSSGVVTTRFAPQDPVVLAKLRRVPLLIGCTGSFPQIARFVQSLERLPTTVWIEDLKLEKSEKTGENVQCELSLAIFAVNSEDSDKANLSEKPI